MSRATIAVLMTLYRGDRLDLFREAVASLERQEYPRERVRWYLCVDGPLPSEHEAVLAEVGCRFHHVHRKPENQGLARGLNDLLDRVGDEDYLMRMDGDDVSLPRRFAAQVEFMEAHRDVDLVGCNAEDFDDTGSVLRRRDFPENHADILRALPRLNPVLHPTYCMRGETMRRTRTRYPDAYLTEDWIFLFEAVRAGWRLHNLQERLFRWRTTRDFYRRRSDLRRGWTELRWATWGIWRAFGLTPGLVWPVARFAFRLLPPGLVRVVYESRLRNLLTRPASAARTDVEGKAGPDS